MARVSRRISAALVCGLVFAPNTLQVSQLANAAAPPQVPSNGLRVDLLQDLAEADLAVHGSQNSLLPFAQDGFVTVLLATAPGRAESIAQEVRDMSGQIQYQDDELGYLRVRLRADQWPRVESVAGVVAAQLDGRRMMVSGWTDSTETAVRQMQLDADVSIAPRPEKRSAPANSELPAASPEDMQAPLAEALQAFGIDRLRARHPTFDGRGVTIAIVEDDASSALLNQPAFGRALALDGTPVPKIRDIVPTPEKDWSRIPAQHQIRAHERSVRIEGRVYLLPRAGSFSWGVLTLAHQHYAVLWNRDTGETWIDINQDDNFGNDPILRDTRRHPDVAQFSNDPGWAGGQFAVLQSAANDEVILLPLFARHPTMVASVAAGSDTPGNFAVGIAPAAQLVLVDANGSATHVAIEAVARAMRRPDVDIVSASFGLAGSLPASDGEVAGLMFDRLITICRKPLIRSVPNGYASELSRSSSGSLPLSVGALLTPAVGRRYFDLQIAAVERVAPYSSRGPRSDGRIWPDVVAPASVIAAGSCNSTVFRRWSGFQLPDCTMLSSGTSGATAAMAGFMATLLSGARQQSLASTGQQLMSAARATARFMPQFRSIDQGNGVPNASAAWNLLENGTTPPTIETSGPLLHQLTSYQRVPARGQSLYERDGWVVGQTGKRAITLTRLDGPLQPQTYRIQWHGNDGTFDSPHSVVLRRGQPTELSLTIRAGSSGLKSALLLLIDEKRQQVVQTQELTIAVADVFSNANEFVLQYAASLSPWGRAEHVFRVPSGLYALRVKLHVGTNQTNVWFLDPRGYFYDRRIGTSPLLPYAANQETEFVIPDPQPGTWFVIVAVDTVEKPPATSYALDLSAVKLHVTTEKTPDDQVLISLQNEGASLQAGQAVFEVGHPILRESRLVKRRGPGLVDFQIPSETSSFLLRASTPGSPCGTQLYLYNCTSGTCLRHDALVPAAETQVVRIAAPQAGNWKAVVTLGPACLTPERVDMEVIRIRQPSKAAPRRDPGAGILLRDEQQRITLSKESWTDQGEAGILLLNYAGLVPTVKQPASATIQNVIVPTGFILSFDGGQTPSPESRPARTAPSR